MKQKNDFLITKINKKQATDAGMALVLILLLIGFFNGQVIFYQIAIPVLILLMIIPMLFYPFAVLWLSLAHLLGTIMTKVLLSLIFIVIVMPVGLIRRLSGKDSLRLRQFKKGKFSVMVERNKWFTREDIETPY